MPLDLVISHYRVLEAIGEGGMGEVYLGIDETLRRKVALKSIRPEHRLDRATKARFLKEARTLSQLDHPNICRVHDYIETADRDWIVLEMVEGRTLHDALQYGADRLDRLAIAQQIAAVLVVTHAAGVVHRDLKPGNVMITTSGQVKVLDFGLSATVSGGPLHQAAMPGPGELEASSLEETRMPAPATGVQVEASQFKSEVGRVKGTAAYMSPEQARGEIVTSASDMYSYGLVLQELYTGKRPYQEGLNYHQVLEQRGRGEIAVAAGMPAHVSALVRRLTLPPPSQRPTAVETAERLRWIGDAPRRLRRNLLAAGLMLAAVFGAARYTIDLARERNAALAARDEAEQRRGQAESLIGFMVGDLREKLTAVGRLDVLDAVGQQALNYFASVPAGTLTDEELYRRSQALHQLGQIRQARADLPGALKAYEDSLAEAEAVVRRNPDNAEWQLGLGTSHFYVGDLKRRGGDLAAARAHFQAYQQIAERLVQKDPTNFTFRLEQSYGHSNVAAIYQREGNLAKAREQLELTAALQAELVKQKPGDQTLLQSRGNNFNRLGIVQDSLGELDRAAESFARELDVYASILKSDARNARVRQRAEISHMYRGVVLRALGRTDEAVAEFQAGFREAQDLAALDATNAVWQRDLATAQLWLGRTDLDQGNVARAHERFREAMPVFAMLAQKNPARSAEIRDLARSHHGLAEILRARGQLDAAGRESDTALALLQPLSEKDPRDVEVARDLAGFEIERGLISAAGGRNDAARAAWNRAAARLEPLVKDSRDRNLLDPWVRALLHLDRIDEAKAGVQRLLSIGYRDRRFLALWQQKSASSTDAR